MTDFKPRKDLQDVVARMVQKAIERALQVGVREAKKLAPALKEWVTREDDVVRPEHRDMHGTQVPENLHFKVRSPSYDIRHYGVGKYQLMKGPRDESASPGLTENCRCELKIIPDGISHTVKAQGVRIIGSKVIGRITAKGPLLSDAEFGTDKDRGERFMGRALKAIKRWLQSGGGV